MSDNKEKLAGFFAKKSGKKKFKPLKLKLASGNTPEQNVDANGEEVVEKPKRKQMFDATGWDTGEAAQTVQVTHTSGRSVQSMTAPDV